MTLSNLSFKEEEGERTTFRKLLLKHKMDPKQLTDDKLWDGYWLEEKYPHKFKKNKQ